MLSFPPSTRALFEPYLPPTSLPTPSASPVDQESETAYERTKPFVTLTYATSLDSNIALAPGTRTSLSGQESKAFTHYLRSRHDAILIGVGTAIADDPGLNSRLEDVDLNRQPRPVVLDPRGRWAFTRESKVISAAREGKGKGPWILSAQGPVPKERMAMLEECGGDYLFHALEMGGKRTAWEEILAVLWKRGIRSVMVEGGGTVLNDLLALECRGKGIADTVMITVAPVFLGMGGVSVCPERPSHTSHSEGKVSSIDAENHTEADDGADERDKEEKTGDKASINGEEQRRMMGGELESETERRETQRKTTISRGSGEPDESIERTSVKPSWQGLRMLDVRWIPLGSDAVMCGATSSSSP